MVAEGDEQDRVLRRVGALGLLRLAADPLKRGVRASVILPKRG